HPPERLAPPPRPRPQPPPRSLAHPPPHLPPGAAAPIGRSEPDGDTSSFPAKGASGLLGNKDMSPAFFELIAFAIRPRAYNQSVPPTQRARGQEVLDGESHAALQQSSPRSPPRGAQLMPAPAVLPRRWSVADSVETYNV